MSSSLNSLCQAMILEGIKPSDEVQIEKRLGFLIDHNGPEFVLATLKVLKEHTVSNLDGENHYKHENGKVSVAWNHHVDAPKGPLGLIYKQFPSPERHLRVIGALIQSIELDELTSNQVEKFEKGLLSEGKVPKDRRPLGSIPDRTLISLERRIAHHWKIKDQFSGVDLTASALPYGTYTENISRYKRVLAERSKPSHEAKASTAEITEAIAVLDKHMINQFYTAPKQSRAYWNEMSAKVGRDDLRISPKIHMTPHVYRDYERLPLQGNWPEDLAPYLGTIGLLQKPGGKLRSVVNVNRFVNSSLTPYADALEDVFYKASNICVMDQQAGLAWVQQKLRDGIHLTSLDLSQATDLLDFRVLTRELGRLGEKTPMLTRSARYFTELAELPLYVPDLDGAISFHTGQPLGMAGSFQTLTVMNYLAGYRAAVHSGLDPRTSFMVCGDDFVCDSRMAAAYNRIISDMSGKTNLEKSLSSDRYAEFLSQLITRDKVVPMKPYYRPGRQSIWTNAEKSTKEKIGHVYRLSQSDRDCLDLLAEYSDSRYSNLPSVRGSYKRPLYDRVVAANYLAIITDFREGGVWEPEKVSQASLEFAHREHDVFANEDRETDRRVYTRHENRDGSTDVVYTGISRGVGDHEDGRFSTAVTKYDHHTAKRVDVSSLKAQLGASVHRVMARRLGNLTSQLDSAPNGAKEDLGNGLEAPQEDIALLAMSLAEKQLEADDQQVESVPALRKKIPDLTLTESDLSFVDEIKKSSDGPNL